MPPDERWKSDVSLDALDHNRLHDDIFVRFVLAIARDADNFIGDILAFDYFAEDCVFAGEPRRGSERDEELRAVGIGAGVGHRELAGLVEFVRRAFGFVLELIAGATHTGARRITALDHELGDHAMEDGSIVETVVAFLAADGMRPLTL